MSVLNAHWLFTVVACVALLPGCAHIERAEYDPCADGSRGRSSGGTSLIVACYALEIPFRLTVVDATTQAPLVGAIAVDDWYLPPSDGFEDDKFGVSVEDGVIEGKAWTLVGVPTPYTNACFRSRFRGILIEIRNDGYIPYRGYVPLPAAEGDVADLGVIRLEVKQERSQ